MKANGIESRQRKSKEQFVPIVNKYHRGILEETPPRNGPALSKKRRFMSVAKLGFLAVPPNDNSAKYIRKNPSLGSASNLKEAPAWMKAPESASESYYSEDDSKRVPRMINVPGSSESQQEELSQMDNLSNCQAEEGEELQQTQQGSPEFSLLFQGQSSQQRERAMHLLNWDCSAHKETRRVVAPLPPTSSPGFSHLFGNQPELGKTAENLLSWHYQTPKPSTLKKPTGQSSNTDTRPISPDHSARSARSALRKQFDAAQALLNLPHTKRKEAQGHPNPMGPPPLRPSTRYQSVYPGVVSSATQQSATQQSVATDPSAVDAMAMAYFAELHQQSTIPSPYFLNFHLGWSGNLFKR
jgi:hypothetical protein